MVCVVLAAQPARVLERSRVGKLPAASQHVYELVAEGDRVQWLVVSQLGAEQHAGKTCPINDVGYLSGYTVSPAELRVLAGCVAMRGAEDRLRAVIGAAGGTTVYLYPDREDPCSS